MLTEKMKCAVCGAKATLYSVKRFPSLVPVVLDARIPLCEQRWRVAWS